MTTQQQKKLMYNIFGAMMTGGHFDNQQQMAKELKAIHYLLKEQEGLSEQECDNCLLYFFQEYGKGCSQPLTDSLIKENMIPIIKNFGSMDVAWGLSLITAAKIHL